MLDGAARVEQVVARAVADGQPAIGITDHGNMYGVLDFYKACNAEGIKPVIGIEAYMAAASRFDRPARRGRVDDTGGEGERGEKLYYHLILLAESTAGYRNMMKLSSDAFLEGYFYKPRCLVAGQEIVGSRGATPIERVRAGDLVLTHRGRLRPVLQTMRRAFSGTVYGVRLGDGRGGREERVTWMTGEHPVLVAAPGAPARWVEARHLGDRLGDALHGGSSLAACLPVVRPDRPLDTVALPSGGEGFVTETMALDHESGVLVGLFAAAGRIEGGDVVIDVPAPGADAAGAAIAESARLAVKRLTGADQSGGAGAVRPSGAIGAADRRPGGAGAPAGAPAGAALRWASAPLAALLGEWCAATSGGAATRLPAFAVEACEEFRLGVLAGARAGTAAGAGAAGRVAGAAEVETGAVTASAAPVETGAVTASAAHVETGAEAASAHGRRPPRAPDLAWQLRTLAAGAGGAFPADASFEYRPIVEVLTRHHEGEVFNIEVAGDHSYVSDFAIHNCDWELLDRYHEGIIATTGCLGGVVLQAMLNGEEKKAYELAGRLQDIFGRDNLFVELQDHGMPEQRRTNPLLLEMAKALRAPVLATNDSHYTDHADSVSHDALLCVQTGSTIDDPNRFKFSSDQHYLKSAAEMRHVFRDVPEACDNSLWIAERANVEIEFGKPQLPRFPVPEGFDGEAAYLRHLTYEGARERYGATLPAEVVERLEYELSVIEDMGFSAYFLVVWDLIRHAKSSGIRVGPGRGSAAGCCVAYCLRIVDLDPIRYDLLFERFLNPGRKQMPDIDMDFDERYRGEMIRYAAEKYGRDHVAQIVTFSTIKARAAVRDAARVLGYPYAVGDRVAKAMPPLVMGRDTPLYACFERHPKYDDGYKAAAELREMCAADPDVKQVVDVARGLEGLRRQDGIHAAAVVITNEPLTEYLPIQRKPGPGEKPEDAPIVTQYEMHGVEELGLLKMDFLGLRNLSVIERALDLIEESTGTRPDIDAVPLDDEATLAMLRRGDSVGVFQLEGGPMRALMRSLAPTSFEDIAALVALYRPGPMAANMHNDYADRKNGRKPIEYLHPDLEPILGDTQGLMIYQESVMRVAQKFAGYSLEEADNLRKACGKKIRELIAKEREKFVEGCERTGYGREVGTKLFDIIEPFADYAFNRSHSVGYGYVSYQTAWLKAHHPAEYLAALLTSVKDDKDATAKYLAECRAMGIEVRVPDVNVSASEFTVRDGAIPFGMSAVRNVGEGLVQLIVAEREANGPYADFYDFVDRVDPQVLNRRTIESLIKAGAFDSLGHPRKGLCLVFETILDRTIARRRREAEGQFDLFADLAADPAAEGPAASVDRVPIPGDEFEKMQRLAFEKEMLGLYVSDHPLMGAEAALRRRVDCSIDALRDGGEGDVRVVGGVVTALARKYTKKGELMATFVLEDLEAAIEAMVFPRVHQEYGSLLVDDAVVTVKGRLDTREEPRKLIVMEVRPVVLDLQAGPPVHLALPLATLTDSTVDGLKRLLLDHPGESPVFLHVGEKVLKLPDDFRVDASNGLLGEVRVVLGDGAVLLKA